jgi:hypothetical protein
VVIFDGRSPLDGSFLSLSTQPFPKSFSASTVIAGPTVQYIGCVTPMPEVAVSDWEVTVAVPLLASWSELHRSGLDITRAGGVCTFSKPAP